MSSYSVLEDIEVDGEPVDTRTREREDNSHEDIPIMQREFEESHGEHLGIWNQCCHTPEEAKKPFRRSGGFSGTDINPQWRMRKMTEMFGAVGTGWGWKVHDRWSEDFPSGKCVFVVCSVWFIQSGKPSWTGEQIGGTEAGRTPDEAYKMAVTDAIGKCMSAIGVGADIYLGQCDSKYQRAESEPRAAQAYQAPPVQQPQYTSAGAYSEPVQRPAQQPAYQTPQAQPPYQAPQAQPPQQYQHHWQSVTIRFGKNEGRKLGSLSANSLSWYQTDWIASRQGKKLSEQDAELYNALIASMGKLSLGAPKEAVPF